MLPDSKAASSKGREQKREVRCEPLSERKIGSGQTAASSESEATNGKSQEGGEAEDADACVQVG
jgi:hypothetical protein